jgi:nucleoid-associated protein YgaU
LILLSVGALVFSALVSGCNKPTAELKRAEAAIADAKKAGAGQYASPELASAEKALSEGKGLMDNLQYKKARASFEEAYRLAQAARDKALAANHTGEIFGPGQTSAAATYSLPSSHTVYEGECLWRISEYKDIYGDAFQWPLIYDANRDQINQKSRLSGLDQKMPDGAAHWIFPGQQFDIPRDASTDQIKNARSRAGAPTPYLPPGQ